MSKVKISFYTQGCRLNQAESAVLERDFESKGFQVVPFKEPSDIVVVNTCTVTENGDSDTRRLVNRIVRDNPDAKIALVGCQAQVLKEQLLKLPHVSWVVGNAQKMSLPLLLSEPQTETPKLLVSKIVREPFTNATPGIDLHHKRANLKIQDGCDFFCSFCVIPFARGPARSRVFDDLVKEAKALAEAGHQEIILTGINIGTYNHDYKGIMDVVHALEEIPKIKRIRISSIEPTTIPKQLIEHMGKSEKLCSYCHIPIQGATDEILSGMSRKYTLKEYDDFVSFVRGVVPDVCIGTDIIVGFPGETDELFEKGMDYLREAPIDYFHVFSYSERAPARSKKLENQISPQVKAVRSQLLRDLSSRKRALFLNRFEGRVLPVIFEQKKRGEWLGTTENFIRVRVASDEGLENQLRHVKLLRVENEEMIGQLV